MIVVRTMTLVGSVVDMISICVFPLPQDAFLCLRLSGPLSVHSLFKTHSHVFAIFSNNFSN